MDVPPSATRSVLVIVVVVMVVVVTVIVVIVVVSTEDETVESVGRDEEAGDSNVDDGTVEESWVVGVVISVVWPTPEPAVPWAVVDVVSWKRARIIGVSFSGLGVVWGTLVVSLLISVAGIGLGISGGGWLVVTPVSSVELTSWAVVIGGVVASRVSLSVVSLTVTGANCVVVDIAWLVSTFSTPFTVSIESTPGAIVVCSVFVSRDVDGVVVIVFTEGSVVTSD